MDEQTLAQAYARLRGPLAAHASRFVGHDEADDVVNASFEVVWKQRNHLDFSGEKNEKLLVSYLYSVVRNKSRCELRRRAVRRKHSDAVARSYALVWSRRDPEQEATDRNLAGEALRSVERVAKRAPTLGDPLLVEVLVGETSYGDYADARGVANDNTVRSHLLRLRRAVSRDLVERGVVQPTAA